MEKSKEILNKAIDVINQRILEAPDYGFYRVVEKQLLYVYNALNCASCDRSMLKKVVLGHYAVREFEDTDPELADVLIDVQFFVSQMVEGKRID